MCSDTRLEKASDVVLFAQRVTDSTTLCDNCCPRKHITYARGEHVVENPCRQSLLSSAQARSFLELTLR